MSNEEKIEQDLLLWLEESKEVIKLLSSDVFDYGISVSKNVDGNIIRITPLTKDWWEAINKNDDLK